MKIFLSSTFQDLESYRAAALRGLRQLRHDAIAMEDFTAASAPPLQRVLEKVAEADAYIGVFAWRYGFIPQANASIPADLTLPAEFKKGETSITHAEYLEARRLKKPVLAFLLDESAPWPPYLMDTFNAEFPAPEDAAPGQQIRNLRTELQNERIVAYFSSPEDLEARVIAAVTVLGMSRQVTTNLSLLTQPIDPFGSDARVSMKQAIEDARRDRHRFLTIDISHTWWSTRLFLLAVLTRHFSEVQRILVVNQRDFVGLLSPGTITLGLEPTDRLLRKYLTALQRQPRSKDLSSGLEAAVTLWEGTFDGQEEERMTQVTVPNLRDWFGEAMLEHPLAVTDLSAADVVDLMRIIDYPSELVPVKTSEKALKRLQEDWKRLHKEPGAGGEDWLDAPIVMIDKRALNDQLAQRYLDELMDRAGLR